MKKQIRGKCYVVGDDIDTDQIIPAQYLSYSLSLPEERKMYARFALSGIPEKNQGLPEGGRPFVREGEFKSDYTVVLAGKNFGCGSSREHASFCMREAGIKAVVAEFYSRIFFRNSVNGGYLIPFESDGRLVENVKTGDEVEIDVKANTFENISSGKTFHLKPLGEVLPIIEAGDVFKYAKTKGMMK
ncbi:MAG: 3-isopropylmalate dehydratase [Candidatus Omnitrophica bacterium]|nr:3-isopropylmalate dehydratase [Candidatus Omnitrophota bacterium]